MKALLFDLDGVFYQGDQVIDGAAATLGWVRQQQIPHLFLTNTSSRARKSLAKKLAGLDLTVAPEAILSPPVVAASWLRRNVGGAIALFVPEATRPEFEGLELLEESAEEGAAAVVMGYLGEGWDFDTLNRAFRLLMAEPRPRLIALGMTRYWHPPQGLTLDLAPFVVALEYATGLKAEVLGKPAAPFFRAALDLLGSTATETFMVGDDIRGDIEGAQCAGLKGILVRTGKFRPGDLQENIRPTAVIDSVAELPVWWREHVASVPDRS